MKSNPSSSIIFHSINRRTVKQFSWYGLLSLLLFISSCTKDPVTPNLTGELFEFKVNGKKIIAPITVEAMDDVENDDPSLPPYKSIAITGVDVLSTETFVFLVALVFENQPKTGTFSQNGECTTLVDCPTLAYFIDDDKPTEQNFTLAEVNSQTEITFEILEYRKGGRVKGTFKGTMEEEDTGEIIEITDGKFDVFID